MCEFRSPGPILETKVFMNILPHIIVVAYGIFCGAHGAVLSLPQTPFLPYPYKGAFTHLVPSGGESMTVSNAEICFFASSFSASYDEEGNEIYWENGGAIIMGQGNSGAYPGVSTYAVEVLIEVITGWPMQLSGGTSITDNMLGGNWQRDWSYEWSGGDGQFNSTWGNFLAFRILASDGTYYGYEILDWNQTGPTIEDPTENPTISYALVGYGRIETSANTSIMVIPESSPSVLLLVAACLGLSRRNRRNTKLFRNKQGQP
jgi:hypothetical protein